MNPSDVVEYTLSGGFKILEHLRELTCNPESSLSSRLKFLGVAMPLIPYQSVALLITRQYTYAQFFRRSLRGVPTIR